MGYAFFLTLFWGVLVFLNFTTVGRIIEYFNETNQISYTTEKRNYYSFLQCFMIFSETCVYLNAAYDAFDTSDLYESIRMPLKKNQKNANPTDVYKTLKDCFLFYEM